MHSHNSYKISYSTTLNKLYTRKNYFSEKEFHKNAVLFLANEVLIDIYNLHMDQIPCLCLTTQNQLVIIKSTRHQQILLTT